MNWEVVEEWAKRDKFGVDGGLTAVAYRDELIKCARLAVAERERADELARERNKAIEEAKREDTDDWIDDLYHRMAEAENRLDTLTLMCLHIDRQVRGSEER